MSLAISPKKSKKGGGSDTADKFSKVKLVLSYSGPNPGVVALWLMATFCLCCESLTKPVSCEVSCGSSRDNRHHLLVLNVCSLAGFGTLH